MKNTLIIALCAAALPFSVNAQEANHEIQYRKISLKDYRDIQEHSDSIDIPEDSAGKTFHVICEVRDDGVPNLTSYRRIIFAPQASTN